MELRSTQQARQPDQPAVNLLGSNLLTVLRRTTIVRVSNFGANHSLSPPSHTGGIRSCVSL